MHVTNHGERLRSKDAYHLHFSRPLLACTSRAPRKLYRDVAASGSRMVELGNEHLELLIAVDRADDGIE